MGILHDYNDYRKRPQAGIHMLPSVEAEVIPIGPHLVRQLPEEDRFFFVRHAHLRSFRLVDRACGLYMTEIWFEEPIMTVMLELLWQVRVLRGTRMGTRELLQREIYHQGEIGTTHNVLILAGPMRAIVTPTGGPVEIHGVGANRTALYAPDGTLVSSFLP